MKNLRLIALTFFSLISNAGVADTLPVPPHCGTPIQHYTLQTLYHRYLGRPLILESKDEHSNIYAFVTGTKTINQIETILINSPEYRARGREKGEDINALYNFLLGRDTFIKRKRSPFINTELNAWLHSGLPLPEIAKRIRSSTEYKNKKKNFPQLLPAVSNLPMLDLYVRILGRFPNFDETNRYLTAFNETNIDLPSLVNGTLTIRQLENILLNSDEFKSRELLSNSSLSFCEEVKFHPECRPGNGILRLSISIHSLFNAYLNRSPTLTELKDLYNLAFRKRHEGPLLKPVVSEILNSPECRQ